MLCSKYLILIISYILYNINTHINIIWLYIITKDLFNPALYSSLLNVMLLVLVLLGVPLHCVLGGNVIQLKTGKIINYNNYFVDVFSFCKNH